MPLSGSAEACIDLPGLEQELPNEFKVLYWDIACCGFLVVVKMLKLE